MSGSERTLEVHFLHLIRVDYSVPQPCSRQSHTKGGPGPVCTGALSQEEPDISPHWQIKACLPTASHPFLPLFTHRLWCGRACGVVRTCIRVSAEMVCGVLPLNHGGPWSPPVTPVSAVDPLSTLTRVLPSRLPSFSLSPSLVALITLHVPCPFKLATKVGDKQARQGTRALRSAY